MTLKVIIEPGEQSGYVVHIPALPGCWSQGSTHEEAIANIKEAAETWLEVEQDKADRSESFAQFELITI